AEDKEAGSSQFEQRTRELWLQSADALPGSVRSRLTQARYAALAAHSSKSTLSFTRRWMPAGAVAGVVLALFVVLAPHGSSNSVARLALVGGPPVEDLDMLTDSDALPLNGDQDVDFDFYEWAAEEATVASAPAVGS
ncbi:MAG TPA: hypothetical protein VNZ06_14280, partial [Steroidobacteraceae bacterium]|nr:hypothetical protein [Steroidobacteraceae bacterium]